jgi:periplasmic divalent cation tolerance protein
MTDKRIVLTTASSEEEARKIARHLLEHRLAACVNIVPQVASIYLWQGKIEETREWVLVIKTTVAAFGRVREAIAELHSYELPECILPND